MRFFFLYLISFVLFFCFSGFAEDLKLEGVRLVESAGFILDDWTDENPIDIRIDCNQNAMKERLSGYLHQPITEESLVSLKQSIIQEFKDRGLVAAVQIPEQKISEEIPLKNEGAYCPTEELAVFTRNKKCQAKLVVVVNPLKTNELKVVGNRWFSKQAIRKTMGVSKGALLKEDQLMNGAGWINRNPFIHADVIISGRAHKDIKYAVDIELLVNDRFPARFYGGVDNTGNSFSGNNRLFTGVSASLGLSTLFTYQFTTAPDFPEFLAHYGNFTFFLPWKHELVFYGGYATIHPEITDFESKGQNIQTSMRYQIPLKPLYTSFQQEINWGADFKRTNSDLFFLGAFSDGTIQRILVNQKMADLFQFCLGYKLSDSFCSGNFTFHFDAFFSPFIFLPHQTTTDYNALRENADIRYFYGRLACGARYHLPKQWEGVALIRGQAASGALLPSEQYGLGGYDTVRGYQERVYLADNAIIANFELRTPPLSFFKKDKLHFLAFLDTAYGYNWHVSAAFPQDAWLLGIGPGVRYDILPYLTTRFDYGFRIHNTSFGNGQIGRFHFSVIAGY